MTAAPDPHGHTHRHTHSDCGHEHAHDHATTHHHGHAQGHAHHDPLAHDQLAIDRHHRGRLALAFALTAGFMLLEAIGGAIAGSLALMADAGHMLTDAAALGLAWLALRIAARPADHKRSFGYQRLRVIATFLNGLALLMIVGWIAFEAIARMLQPQAVEAWPMLWIAVSGAIANLVVFAILRPAGHDDMNMAAASLHVMSDLLGSLAAILSAVIILTTGWLPADPLLSLLVCVLLVRSAWYLVKRSTHILLEGSPEWLNLAELRSTLEHAVPAIQDVHHVHCWLVGPQDTLLTMHVQVAPEADHVHTLRQAKEVLAEQFGITHATIQIESSDCLDADCTEQATANG
ncbi:MAG: cation diffusion facilitator family transporter [Steroidobacteraceae bacterium]